MDYAVILHWPSVRLGLLSPSRARGHRGHGGHAAHGSSLDGGLVRYEPEENSGGGSQYSTMSPWDKLALKFTLSAQI